MKRRFRAALAMFVMALAARASEPLRPVSSTWTLEAGGAQIADTYLTPLKYSGMHLGLGYERAQAMRFKPRHWVNSLRFSFEFDRAKNPSGNSTMYSAGISAGWSMLHTWRLPYGIGLAFGVAADADLGALLLARNSNNPAQARASLTLSPQVSAYWRKGIWGVGARLRTPLLGVFFSPDYGELYYEISLGNHSDLVHFAWPGSYRRCCGEAFVDIRPGATAIRLGYRADLLSFSANGLTGRMLTNSVIIGVNCDFLSVDPRKKYDAEIITANY